MRQPKAEFEDIVPGVGFLTDKNIEAALKAGFLIEPGTWEEGQIRHASYMLRLGQRVQIERDSTGSGEREQKVITLTRGGPPLELRPGETALLYSIENLRLPNCVLGFTVARGLLFAECLVPENTYVDPGFPGSIYTVVTNLSGRVLKLPYGTPIARLFFYRLAENVAHPYQSGPAIGIDQHLEFSPGIRYATLDKASAASTVDLLSDLISTERGGPRTAALLQRNATLSRYALLIAIAFPIALQLASSWTWLRNVAGPALGNVLLNIIAGILVIIGERIWRKRTEKQ
jgi:deoxycytidine triphosphate deaminase